MKFVTKNGKVAALIQAEDQLSSADQVMALLEEAFERDCVGFVLPRGGGERPAPAQQRAGDGSPPASAAQPQAVSPGGCPG